jgi:hypothetical protein
VRRLLATCLLAAAVCVPAARADGDPASDVLFSETVYLPVSSRVSSDLARQLVSVARPKLKVAVIAAPIDLGAIPSLFGRPQWYARYLGSELRFVFGGRLLVVMPQGAALSQRGRLLASFRLPDRSGADGLVRSAIAIIRGLRRTRQ